MVGAARVKRELLVVLLVLLLLLPLVLAALLVRVLVVRSGWARAVGAQELGLFRSRCRGG
jgi:hypothetical protein